MTLTKLLFFIGFLTGGWLLYFCFPKKLRYLVLLGFSLAFIYLISGWLLAFILLDVMVIYLFGIWLDSLNQKAKEKKKGLDKDSWHIYKKKNNSQKLTVLWLGIILIILPLLGLKYLNLFIKIIDRIKSLFGANDQIASLTLLIPLGLSYYSLQAISYLVDVKRGRYPSERNIFKLCLFVCFFPQLVEGPIGRYDHLKPTLLDGQTEVSFDNYFYGLLTIAFGAFQKMVIADRLSIFVSAFFKDYANYSGWMTILGILGFTFQLYCDFAGTILVFTGMAKCFGITLDQNFNNPFFSLSVSEFWRRWHITLGNWFKDYVFYPLSMSKLSLKMNKRLNDQHWSPFWASFVPMSISLVMLWGLTGLRHGAATKYLVYGLYYGIIMILESIYDYYTAKKKFRKNPICLGISWLATFFLVNVGMLMFRAGILTVFWSIFTSLFRQQGEFDIFSIFTATDLYVSLGCLSLVFLYDASGYFHLTKYLTIKKVPSYLLLGLVFVGLALSIGIMGIYGQGYDFIEPIYGGF